MIKHRGSFVDASEARAALEIVFDWIEEREREALVPLIEPPTGNPEELLGRLRDAGYCGCTRAFGCVACGGRTFGQ